MIPSRVVVLMFWVVAGCLQMLAAAPQSLRWLAPDLSVLVLGVPHTCRAEASSGLPVHFRVLSGPAVLEGDQLVVTNVDDVVVIAEQPGNGDFSPGSAIRSFNAYRVDIEPEPEFQFGSRVLDLVTAGDLTLALETQGGVLITRVPAAGPVTQLAHHRVRGRVQSIAASDTHLYTFSSLGRLEAADLRDPERPALVGWLDFPFPVTPIPPTSLALQDGLLFVGAGPFGLAVVDVRDPVRMQLLSWYSVAFDPPGGSGVTQIVPAGNRLYLNVTAGLQIADISDPASPRWIGGFTRWGPNRIVRLEGHLAGMVHGGRLTVLDVRDPMKVQELGHHDFRDGRSTIANLRSVGDQLVLTDTSGALEVLSLRNPSSPRILGRHVDWFRNGAFGSAPLAVLHEAGRVLIAGSDGVIEPLRLTRRIPQELEWLQPASDALALHQTHPLEAKASSGLPVEWSVVSGPAVIGPEGLQITGRGAVAVVARQPGNREVAPVELHRAFNPTILHPQRLGRMPLGGPASDLLVSNRLAFVALDNAGVKVVDLNRPADPVLLSSFSPIPYSRRMARIGDHLVVVGSEDLAIVDVREPSQPVVRSRMRPGWFPLAVETMGSQVLVAAGGEGVQVIDLADPANPRISGEIAIPRYTHVLEVGPPGVVVGHLPGVALWDFSNPLAATRHSVLGGADGFEINQVGVGETLLVAAANRRDWQTGRFQSSRLEVYGIDDPTQPRLLGTSVATGPGFGRITVHEGWAFVETSVSEELEHLVFDIRDPVRPRLAGRLPGTALVVPAETLLVATTTAHELVTYSWQEAMTQQLKWASPDDSVLDPGVVHLLRATASSGLPVEYTVLSGPAEIRDGVLSVTNDTQQQSIIVRATQSGGPGQLPGESVRVFNQMSVDLELLGELKAPGYAFTVVVSGKYVGVGELSGPLLWVDVADPHRPRLAGRLEEAPEVIDLVVSEGFVYAVGDGTKLKVVDIRNPATPVVVASMEAGVGASRVIVHQDHAYVAVAGSIQVVDVLNPPQPRLVGHHPTPGPWAARSLLARDGFLHVSGFFDGLTILDVRDPSRPVPAGSLPSDSFSAAWVLEGSLLWFRQLRGGLSAVDVSDPFHPRWGAEAEKPMWNDLMDYKSMALQDGLILCPEIGSLRIVEISNPHHPLTAGNHPMPGDSSTGIAVVGDLAYVAAGSRGLLIFRIHRGIRSEVGDLGLPSRGEAGERIPLPAHNPQGVPLRYEVVSGPAQIQEGALLLAGPGPVTLKAAVVPAGRYLPAEALLPISAMPLVLHTVRGSSDEPTRLDWRKDTDVLEWAAQPGGPWTLLPDARPPFRPVAGDSPRFFRVVRP
ncbi:MAG: hypothetical protein J0L84_05955 [Verrucomicrobia bacterium]|nr:hypothetical protein [Verrucomicrobiota bacterium]